MTVYDMMMLAIVLIAVVLGAWRGMVWQLAPIASLVAGYAVAYRLSSRVAPWFGEEAPANRYWAMLMLFGAVSLGVYLVARMLRGFIENMKLDHYDRHLGALFGGVKGIVICLILTFFLVAVVPKARGPLLHSYSGYSAAVIMEKLHAIMPPEMHETIHPYIHSLDESTEHFLEAHDHPGDPSHHDPDEEIQPTGPSEEPLDPDMVGRTILEKIIEGLQR